MNTTARNVTRKPAILTALAIVILLGCTGQSARAQDWATGDGNTGLEAGEPTGTQPAGIISPLPVPPKLPLLMMRSAVDATEAVAPGATVHFTLTLKNTGSAPANNVVVTDTLPDGLFFSDTLGQTRTIVPGGNLAPGDSLTLSYPVTVKSDATTQTYANALRATSDNHPTVSASATVQVRVPTIVATPVVIGSPSLTVTLAAAVDFINSGDRAGYTLTVRNTGTADATNLNIHVTLPAGLTFAETGSAARDWQTDLLAMGETKFITYDVLSDATAVAAMYDTFATVQADNIPAITESATIELREPAVLGVSTEPETAPVMLAASGAGSADVGLVTVMLGLIATAAALLTRYGFARRG